MPRRRIIILTLLLFCAVATPASRAQTDGPTEVVRRFYDWYLGRFEQDDWNPLKNRREALKYLTPEFRVKAPRLSREQDADVIICAQDWQPEWRQSLTVAPAVVRSAKATTTVSWQAGADTYRIKITLKKIGGAWKIDGAACDL